MLPAYERHLPDDIDAGNQDLSVLSVNFRKDQSPTRSEESALRLELFSQWAQPVGRWCGESVTAERVDVLISQR
ncbi:hypothetical protein GCM10017711_23490 [Paeniglutamicibacter sulfureus]